MLGCQRGSMTIPQHMAPGEKATHSRQAIFFASLLWVTRPGARKRGPKKRPKIGPPKFLAHSRIVGFSPAYVKKKLAPKSFFPICLTGSSDSSQPAMGQKGFQSRALKSKIVRGSRPKTAPGYGGRGTQQTGRTDGQKRSESAHFLL